MRRTACYLVYLAVCICLAVSCGRGDSPEDQVRRFIQQGEEAAEARDIGALKDLISPEYIDGGRRGRRDIVVIAARYFMANKNIHIFSRIGELVFPDPDHADLKLYVAMTGQNVSDLDALLNMRADMYLFDLHLIRDGGDWLLVNADWRPATPEDFF